MDNFVSFIAFESVTARLERTIKRLWITILILILAFLANNLGWIYYESTFEVVETTQVVQDVQAESDGNNDIILTTIGGDYIGNEGESTSNSN